MQKMIEFLASRIESTIDSIPNESTTITALVHPFINALGYNTNDPDEFVSEFVSDFSNKGDCADGAIMKNGKPVILLECKHCKLKLSESFENQLRKYFCVHPTAKIGILTNGIEYRFFTDSEEKNIMDKKPFLVFDISDPESVPYDAISLFSKSIYSSGIYEHLKTVLRLKSQMEYEIGDRCAPLAKIILSSVFETKERKSMAEQVLSSVRKILADTVPEEMISIHSTTGHWCSIALTGCGNILEMQFNNTTGKKWMKFSTIGKTVPIKAIDDLISHSDDLIQSAGAFKKKNVQQTVQPTADKLSNKKSSF